jgi:hypothetical protein
MPRFEFVPAGSQHHTADDALLHGVHGLVPYVHCAVRAQCVVRAHDLWCRVLSDRGEFMAGGVVRIDRSRKLPWIRLARVEQIVPLVASLDTDSLITFVRALSDVVPSLAQVTVQVYSARPEVQADLGKRLRAAGFMREPMARSYEQTLLLPLSGGTEALAARLSSSARRNIRQAQGSGFKARPITDDRYGARLATLLQASHARTGGSAGAADFSAMIRAAAARPETSTVIGTFHPERTGVEALVGFAQGTVGHETAMYAVAGTERSPEVGRTPLSYGLLWELLEWGRQRGLAWFDFGGVTAEADEGNPLAGISAFKRKFGGMDMAIAAEYRMITDPLQHRLLDLAARTVGGLRPAR